MENEHQEEEWARGNFTHRQHTAIYGASTVVDGKTAFSIIGVKALQQGFPYGQKEQKWDRKGSDNKKEERKGCRPDRDWDSCGSHQFHG